MANKNTIRVAEFEKLYYDDNRPFKHKHWEALCRFLDKEGITVFKIIHKGIQFLNYVGVIQVEDLTIEVLPKTDRAATTAANSSVADLLVENKVNADTHQKWHDVLLKMLKECRLLRVNHVDYANLNIKNNSILDIYIELFLTEAEKILHEGLTKKYRKCEGNRLSLKGQILFSKNISKNLVHGERFYTLHTDYNSNNIFNQILYKTIWLICSISHNQDIRDKVYRLLLNFPDFPDCTITPTTFENLVFDRKTERYKEAIFISKMLLLNYRPGITGGSKNVIAILFDMNQLWEEFVYRRLLRASSSSYSITRQNSKEFWYNTSTASYKKLRPDIVVTKGGQTIVLDTKWKILTDAQPSDEDLKQLFVYNLIWNAKHSFLVYPGTVKTVQGSYRHFDLSAHKKQTREEQFYNHCSMKFLNVLDDQGRLSDTLGTELLLTIEESM